MPRVIAPHRCQRCEIRQDLCFCAWIPRLELQTRLIVLMHTAEEVLTTNTARLAAKALANSEIRIRGRKDEPISWQGLIEPGRTSLLLYPSSHAVELTAEFAASLAGPVNLIVPDGSWRQTRSMVRREPTLAGIRPVKLPAGAPSIYRLRVQPDDSNLCTLEAIARAVGILESVPAQARLEQMLHVMVERTLWSRGMLATAACTTAGIPAAAFRM